ncbi:EcoRII C terminal [Lachnospiraceae bacterium XBB1006]|nr:EcoRII C terminal [Lachnospiraceae bacterium XBB1006]
MALELEQYKEMVKKERDLFFKSSFERAYQAFCELEFQHKDSAYFELNASECIEQLREQCFNDFLVEERLFTVNMLKKLANSLNYDNMTAEEAISSYVAAYPEHIYQLCLSNTQSRRSRAGKEFEHLIELVLIGANVPFDSQGNIGKDSFVEKGLGKLVDTVSPGVIEFDINKRNCVLISAKTTLRERWQEVPEEMGRTGAREMFLATIDEKVSQNVLDTLYEANIQLTTTKRNKQEHYPNNPRVLTFEELISICKNSWSSWSTYDYSAEQSEQATQMIRLQMQKHIEHPYVQDYLSNRLSAYAQRINEELR